jgi:hypothetical protein
MISHGMNGVVNEDTTRWNDATQTKDSHCWKTIPLVLLGVQAVENGGFQLNESRQMYHRTCGAQGGQKNGKEVQRT